MGLAAASDAGLDAFGPHQPAVFVVVVAAVSEQLVRTLAWSSWPAAHGRDRVQQWEHLGHVVAVAATQGDREGNTVPIG